jgi:sugar lactone lactonase YvrE
VAGNGRLGFSGDGGPATSASLGASGMAVDKFGNLFIADFANSRVRRVDAKTGIITTVAGNGRLGFSGDGGPATSASLYEPEGVAVDGSGNILIDDYGNNRIRRVDAVTGIITTVAGNGSQGFSGDGGPATSASLNLPEGLAVDAAGHVFIGDTGNQRIRRVDLPLLALSAPRPVSPPDGTVFNSFPRTTTLKWEAVPGAIRYVVEVDYYDPQNFPGANLKPGWVSERDRNIYIQQATQSTSYTFEFVGAQPGRWRVWAVGSNGQEGAKSDWMVFRYTR